MQNCGNRNGGMGHEFALKLLLVGIYVLNHPKSIKYILYFKTVSITNRYSMCPLLPSNRKVKTLQIVYFFTIAWLLGNKD